jgi:hypothetical protein
MAYIFDRFISEPKKKKDNNVKSPDNRMNYSKGLIWRLIL